MRLVAGRANVRSWRSVIGMRKWSAASSRGGDLFDFGSRPSERVVGSAASRMGGEGTRSILGIDHRQERSRVRLSGKNTVRSRV